MNPLDGVSPLDRLRLRTPPSPRPLHPPRELPKPGVMPNTPIDRSSDLYKAAVEFEALFIGTMLKAMRQTVPRGPINNGGFAEEVFDDMLWEERARTLARNARFGLADMLYRQFVYLRDLPPSAEQRPGNP